MKISLYLCLVGQYRGALPSQCAIIIVRPQAANIIKIRARLYGSQKAGLPHVLF